MGAVTRLWRKNPDWLARKLNGFSRRCGRRCQVAGFRSWASLKMWSIVLVGRAFVRMRHTSARACREHAVWSQIVCGVKKNRRQDSTGEAPLP